MKTAAAARRRRSGRRCGGATASRSRRHRSPRGPPPSAALDSTGSDEASQPTRPPASDSPSGPRRRRSPVGGRRWRRARRGRTEPELHSLLRTAPAPSRARQARPRRRAGCGGRSRSRIGPRMRCQNGAVRELRGSLNPHRSEAAKSASISSRACFRGSASSGRPLPSGGELGGSNQLPPNRSGSRR